MSVKSDDKFTNEDFDTTISEDYWGISETDNAFSNETPPDDYWEEQVKTDKTDSTSRVGETDNEEYTPQEFTEEPNLTAKKPKKPIGLMILLGIVIIIILFVASKFIKAKKNPTNTGNVTPTDTTADTDIVTTDYAGYKKLLVLGVSQKYGIDYADKTYPTEDGKSLTYTECMSEDTLISQSSLVSITTDAKKSLLKDILDISKTLTTNTEFDITYDTDMINELKNLSYIDKSMLDGVLASNGRNTVAEVIQSESDYDVVFDFDYSYEKLYDKNGSNSVIVEYDVKTDSKGTPILIVRTESAGNVESIPVKVGGVEYELQRDGEYDIINNGFVLGYGYSHVLDNINLGVEYQVQGYVTSARTDYTTIGALAEINKGTDYKLKYSVKSSKDTKTQKTETASEHTETDSDKN